ncbi:urease accessory protein UreD [Cordyceps fumosorosea ARSEF 2679]|uniref:Urease accessory protein UreD n=1 Tax=Cordyceps fumosorosea (strain ARSEF 2679) TaxID=1081104 RepID=A0A167YBT5_CORFA|nr:urease accessory protein UreD [Cordyceps fumosorosea ARSEF 2679]OAA66133.1 urease accessory protein UreD [Cordyceps fumosorosea ARSEF 2679]
MAASPFPKSTPTAGGGRIVAGPLPSGGTGLEVMRYQYPLKLIAPSPSSDQRSVLVFLLSYGGGLVGGDSVDLAVRVRAGARLSLVTQGHTKVFKSPSPAVLTSQAMRVDLDGAGAALCLLPDPVQPFADSVYAQTQVFRLRPDSSLCLLDWVTRGRTARGEDWSLFQWTGRNEVWLQGGGDGGGEGDRLLVRDKVILAGDGGASGDGPLRGVMRGMGVFGTLVLRGELMRPLGEFFLAEFAALPRLGSRDFRTAEARREEDDKMTELERWRADRIDMETEEGVLWSAASVRGCVVVKFAAPEVEAGREWIGSMLLREGSIEANFGADALMCVR